VRVDEIGETCFGLGVLGDDEGPWLLVDRAARETARVENAELDVLRNRPVSVAAPVAFARDGQVRVQRLSS